MWTLRIRAFCHWAIRLCIAVHHETSWYLYLRVCCIWITLCKNHRWPSKTFLFHLFCFGDSSLQTEYRLETVICLVLLSYRISIRLSTCLHWRNSKCLYHALYRLTIRLCTRLHWDEGADLNLGQLRFWSIHCMRFHRGKTICQVHSFAPLSIVRHNNNLCTIRKALT